MNIEIANRLQQLRKQKGYSQEQLADELGISRQAVSKWERAEASPDTDNLILLARLYGVSLDELLSTEQTSQEIKEEKEEADDKKTETDDKQEKHYTWEELAEDEDVKFKMNESGIHIEDGADSVHIGNDGIHIEDGEDSVHIDRTGIHIKSGKDTDEEEFHSHRNHRIADAVTGITALLAVIGYFVLGGFCSLWHPGWLIFFAIPLVGSLCDAIVKKNPSNFAYPVLVAGVYLFLGCQYGWWHPYWVLFITIPIYYIICDLFRRK